MLRHNRQPFRSGTAIRVLERFCIYQVVSCVEERRGKNQTIKVEAASATPLVHSGFHFVCSAQNSKHSSNLKIRKVELFREFCCRLMTLWRDQETLDTVVDIALPSSMSGRPGSTNNRGWERPRAREGRDESASVDSVRPERDRSEEAARSEDGES